MWNRLKNILCIKDTDIIKRVFSIVLVIVLLLDAPVSFAKLTKEEEEENRKNDPFEPVNHVESAVLYHVESGTLLYRKGLYKVVSPGVTAKMMTAIIALEALSDRMEEDVTIPSVVMQNAVGTHMELRSGEIIKIKELFHGLIISNANDAAYMLALLTADNSIEKFIAMMNEKAKLLGMYDTVYTDITGIDTSGSKTTVNDVLLLTLTAYQNQFYKEVAAKTQYTIAATNKKKARELHTKNYLLSKLIYPDYLYKNANGLCAGTAEGGGNTVCASAEINSSNYIAIAMCGSGNYKTKFQGFLSVIALLENIPQTYQYITIVSEGQILGEVKVQLAEEYDYIAVVSNDSFLLYLPSDYNVKALTRFELRLDQESLVAPVEENQVVGEADVYVDGDMLATLTLVTKRGLSLSSSENLMNNVINITKTRTFMIGSTIIAGIALAGFLIAARIRYEKDKPIRVNTSE